MNPKNPQAAGEGFVLVPREATSEMLRTLMSGEHSYDYREGNGYRREELDEHYQSMYRAMLAAAPAIAPAADRCKHCGGHGKSSTFDGEWNDCLVCTPPPAAGDDEDTVECLQCVQRVHPDLARCTDSGWVCDDCMENMS